MKGSLPASKILETSFETTPLPTRGEGVAIQVTEKGLRLLHKKGPDKLFTPEEWFFERRKVHVVGEGIELTLKMSTSDLEIFRRQLNLFRARQQAELHPNSQFEQCPSCQLLHPILSDAPVSFCPECLGMYHGEEVLTEQGGYAFNFCEDGQFALTGPVGGKSSRPVPRKGKAVFRSLRSAARPLKERLIGHLLWMPFCYLVMTLWAPAAIVCVPLIFLSLLMVGCYTTLLTLRGAWKGLRYRPTWPEGHPGGLVNNALVALKRGEVDQARSHLARAHTLCPDHPIISQIAEHVEAMP